VLVMAYGTPASPDDLEAYYTHIRRGRAPTPEQLDDLRRRYDAIGGMSPLLERTRAQVRAVGHELERVSPGTYRVELGMKHAHPFIEDTVETLLDAGAVRIVALVLAPHYSRASVGEYHERVRAAAASRAEVLTIDSWHLEPALLDFQAAEVTRTLSAMPEPTKVLFTAHSLPERVLADDVYTEQLGESAQAIAERIDLLPWPQWAMAWQSAGRTPEPWRGPDILEIIRLLAETGRAAGVLVCAQGFVADHLEVLYDLDVEARDESERVGLAFARTATVGDNASVMTALAGRVHDRAFAR
jgi:ferrochelatase